MYYKLTLIKITEPPITNFIYLFLRMFLQIFLYKNDAAQINSKWVYFDFPIEAIVSSRSN